MSQALKQVIEEGNRYWVMPDGRLLPFIGGAEEPVADPVTEPVTDPPVAPEGDPTPDPSEGTSGQEPSEQFSREYVAKLRQENAATRTKLREAEAKTGDLESRLKAIEDANKSEEEKLREAFSNTEAEKAQLTTSLQETRIRLAIASEAPALGIVDTDAAVKLIDTSKLELDSNGVPLNVNTVLTELVDARPWLQGKTTPPVPKVDPTNSSGGRKGTPLTVEDIRKMSSEEMERRWDEVQTVIASQ